MDASVKLAPVGYRAFISYSHKDAAWGAKLHRRLETYRLPKRCIAIETARGVVPERLHPIFRDREELSAGESLSGQVQAALAASGALIILCSPAAKASLWVAKEIETFCELHPERPVLAALIEGEPEDAFPPALTAGGAEPIAADFRKGKDGVRLGLLKLVAGTTGVGLDTLVQRDAQRQMRRVTAITLAAFAAVLAMALVALFAFRAQKEAEAQRAQAEGLVEYMLTDLRDRLKGVGRLDVMTAVNERAMSYYGAQGDLSKLPPDSLDRRARILHAMGEDDEKRGDLDKALSKFTEAHRATAAVLAQKPNDPDAIYAHAQSEYWVGSIFWERDDLGKAEAWFRRYLEMAERLGQVQPSDQRGSQEIGYALGNLCSVLVQAGREGSKAVDYCSRALSRIERLAQQSPEDQTRQADLANRKAWLADAFVVVGNVDRATELRNQQIGIVERMLATDPANAEGRYRLASAYYSMALLQKKKGAPHAEYKARSLKLLDGLAAQDPGNAIYPRLIKSALSL